MSTVFTPVSRMELLRGKISENSEPLFMRIRAELSVEAQISMKNPLYSVTFTKSRAVSGDPHDYYSEAPYWWPDPKNPGGKFIRRDGEFNPDRMDFHRIDMEKMVRDVYILSTAGYLLCEPAYTARADELLRTWFITPETKMNPHLDYAQAIFGITSGRGIGIIDTVSLIRLIAAMDYFSQNPAFADTVTGLREWFAAYLHWMDTSKNGIDEREYFNNHGNWWNAQAAAFAAFIGDDAMLHRCFERLTAKILPEQTGIDGSFTDELTRTRSYTYCLYNLEACAVTAEIAHSCGTDLWNTVCQDGRSIRKSLDFMLPYYDNSTLWERQQLDLENIRPSMAFQLGAVRIDKKYLSAAKKRHAGLRYFDAVGQMGAPCLLDGFVE